MLKYPAAAIKISLHIDYNNVNCIIENTSCHGGRGGVSNIFEKAHTIVMCVYLWTWIFGETDCEPVRQRNGSIEQGTKCGRGPDLGGAIYNVYIYT